MVNALVTDLVINEIALKVLHLMIGYALQKKLLIQLAKANGSYNDQIITVDSAQGDQYENVILSLVTTRGKCKFTKLLLSLWS